MPKPKAQKSSKSKTTQHNYYPWIISIIIIVLVILAIVKAQTTSLALPTPATFAPHSLVTLPNVPSITYDELVSMDMATWTKEPHIFICPGVSQEVYLVPIVYSEQGTVASGEASAAFEIRTSGIGLLADPNVNSEIKNYVQKHMDEIAVAEAYIAGIGIDQNEPDNITQALFHKEGRGTAMALCWLMANFNNMPKLGYSGSGNNVTAIGYSAMDAMAVIFGLDKNEYTLLNLQPPDLKNAHWLSQPWKDPTLWPSCQMWDYIIWLQRNGHIRQTGIIEKPECDNYSS